LFKCHFKFHTVKVKAANSDNILEFPVKTALTDIFQICYGHQNCAAYYNGNIIASIDGIDTAEQRDPVIIAEYKVWIKLDKYAPFVKLYQPFQTIKELFKQEFKEWDINDYVVKQSGEMIGNTYLSVLSSTADSPINFVPHMIWVKFENEPPCQLDVKQNETIEAFCDRQNLTQFRAKQRDVTLEGDQTLDYHLTTSDNPIMFTPLKVWVKYNDNEPIQLDGKRNETIQEFVIRHKLAADVL